MPAKPAAASFANAATEDGGRFSSLKLDLFPGASQILLLASSAVIILIVFFFIGVGVYLKRDKPSSSEFVPPINVLDVKFENQEQIQRFLSKFDQASKEGDLAKRYILLEQNYLEVLAQYQITHDPEIRAVLVQYSSYIEGNYPDKYKNQNLYSVPCYDKSCAPSNTLSETESIANAVANNSALNDLAKRRILQQFEEASFEQDSSGKFSSYLNALSQLTSEYKATNDLGIRGIHVELSEFIISKFPGYGIPVQLKI